MRTAVYLPAICVSQLPLKALSPMQGRQPAVVLVCITNSGCQAIGADPKLACGPWIDLGTGSGALAIGLASMLPSSAKVQLHSLPLHFAFAFWSLQLCACHLGLTFISVHDRCSMQLRISIVNGLQVWAVDKSESAYSWASLNVSRLGYEHKIQVPPTYV